MWEQRVTECVCTSWSFQVSCLCVCMLTSSPSYRNTEAQLLVGWGWIIVKETRILTCKHVTNVFSPSVVCTGVSLTWVTFQRSKIWFEKNSWPICVTAVLQLDEKIDILFVSFLQKQQAVVIVSVSCIAVFSWQQHSVFVWSKCVNEWALDVLVGGFCYFR